MNEEEEFKRINESLDRYLAEGPDDFEEEEVEATKQRYHELRKAGYGPQPYEPEEAT